MRIMLVGNFVTAFDSVVYGLFAGWISEGMTRVMQFITFWGSELGLTACALFFAIFTAVWKKSYVACGLMAAINLSGGALLNYILKQLIQRPRPDLNRLMEISGYSFPSGHSMSSLIFYGFLIFLSLRYGKHWSKYLIAGALGLLVPAIGISRIYLGVHYASDVLGGFVIGSGWLLFFIRLTRDRLPSVAALTGNQK